MDTTALQKVVTLPLFQFVFGSGVAVTLLGFWVTRRAWIRDRRFSAYTSLIRASLEWEKAADLETDLDSRDWPPSLEGVAAEALSITSNDELRWDIESYQALTWAILRRKRSLATRQLRVKELLEFGPKFRKSLGAALVENNRGWGWLLALRRKTVRAWWFYKDFRRMGRIWPELNLAFILVEIFLAIELFLIVAWFIIR